MRDCRLQRFELAGGLVRARCSCGWLSVPTGTAEEAGRLSDDHRASTDGVAS